MSIITIVGAGMMGSAIGVPAAVNGHEIRLVGTPLDREIISHAEKTGEHLTLKRKLPKEFKFYQVEQLRSALENADLLVGGISSFGVDWFEKEVLSIIPDSMPVLSITKGLQDQEDGSLITFPDLYAKHLKPRRLSLNAVGGPCISFELVDHIDTEVCFCGSDINILRKIKSLFETSFYHISLSTDVNGVECAVAMKNAYALGVSLAVGLTQKTEGNDINRYNPQAALFGQSVREIQRLIGIMKADDSNVMLAAGDLYVTVFGGRTRRLGVLLGEGAPFREALEKLKGVTLESVAIITRAARAVRKMITSGSAAAGDFPLLLYMDEIINQGAPVNIPWKQFESRRES